MGRITAGRHVSRSAGPEGPRGNHRANTRVDAVRAQGPAARTAESSPTPPQSVTAAGRRRRGTRGGTVPPRAEASDEVRQMNVPVYNMQGAEVGSFAIDEQALGGRINPALIKQAYVCYHANLRQGSAKTKNRREVEGSTRKLYRQKGTGNARHGDKKANLFRGGGHGHSKKRTREDYRLDLPKKMRRKANRNALLAKLVDNEVRIIDTMMLPEPK